MLSMMIKPDNHLIPCMLSMMIKPDNHLIPCMLSMTIKPVAAITIILFNYSLYYEIADKFLIGTIKINVSFITTPHVVSSSRRKAGQRALLRDSSNGQSSLISTLSLFLWQVRPTLLWSLGRYAEAVYLNISF
jgi:hypothetical protein